MTPPELKALMERASPAPWCAVLAEEETMSENFEALAADADVDLAAFGHKSGQRFEVMVELFRDDNGTKRNILPVTHMPLSYEANARLIAELRNLAPRLLALWEAGEAYRVASEAFDGHDQGLWQTMDDAERTMLAALKALGEWKA